MGDTAKVSLFDNEDAPIVIKGMSLENLEEYTDTKLNDMVGDGDLRDRVIGAISGDLVNRSLIDEEDTVRYPNYMIDLRGLELHKELIPSLRSMLDDKQDVSLYVIDIRDRLILLGRCRHEVFSNVIAEALKNLYGSGCKLYKDYKPGKQNKHMELGDVTSLRLNI